MKCKKITNFYEFIFRLSGCKIMSRGKIREETENYFWYQDNQLGHGATGHVYLCRHKVNCCFQTYMSDLSLSIKKSLKTNII